MTVPTAGRWDVRDKYAIVTGGQKIMKIRGREDNISVGTWNVRTVRPAEKLEELIHTMGRYHWNILDSVRCPGNTGEMSTDDRHKVYFSEQEDRHEYGVGFFVHKDLVSAVGGINLTSLQQTDLDMLESNSFQYHHQQHQSGHDDTSSSNSRKP